MEKVTVDKSYFDALLRRADFHTTTQRMGRPGHESVTIPKAEYDSLLRSSSEFQLLKNALFAGGLTPDTLALLIAGGGDRQPQQSRINSWDDEYDDQPPAYYNNRDGTPSRPSLNGKSGAGASGFNFPPAPVPFPSGQYRTQTKPHTPNDSRRVSYGVVPSSVPEESAFDEADSLVDDGNTDIDTISRANSGALRTLYFVGFNGRTSYRDLLSVIKGGQLLSINMRSEKSATVTFLDAAADYLAWVKRNDLYLNGKRIEVRWADRQFNLNSHIAAKIASGATRNIVLRRAVEKCLTAERIRRDMEHIHGLVIIDVTYQHGHAYVSTNSVHNALYARTCMMSRIAYRSCKIEFYPDECDVPLPSRAQPAKLAESKPAKKDAPLANRFDMLSMDSTDNASDEENQDPLESQVGDSDDDDDTINVRSRHGVRLGFLDGDSAS